MPEWFRSYLSSLSMAQVEQIRTWIRGKHVGAGQVALADINEALNDTVARWNELIESIVEAAAKALTK